MDTADELYPCRDDVTADKPSSELSSAAFALAQIEELLLVIMITEKTFRGSMRR